MVAMSEYCDLAETLRNAFTLLPRNSKQEDGAACHAHSVLPQ